MRSSRCFLLVRRPGAGRRDRTRSGTLRAWGRAGWRRRATGPGQCAVSTSVTGSVTEMVGASGRRRRREVVPCQSRASAPEPARPRSSSRPPRDQSPAIEAAATSAPAATAPPVTVTGRAGHLGALVQHHDRVVAGRQVLRDGHLDLEPAAARWCRPSRAPRGSEWISTTRPAARASRPRPAMVIDAAGLEVTGHLDRGRGLGRRVPDDRVLRLEALQLRAVGSDRGDDRAVLAGADAGEGVRRRCRRRRSRARRR